MLIKIITPQYYSRFIFSVFISFLLLQPTNAELDLSLPDYNLPNIGNSSLSSIGYSKERYLGLKILRNIRASAPVIEDPEISAWIRSLGNRLSAQAPDSKNPFYFLIIKDNAINAFATLGGVIVINTGLILQTASEDELAAVLAHEIAHITQQHIARMMENSRNNLLSTGATIFAGILAGTKNPQAGQAIISGAFAMQAYKDLLFSREAESEADRVGLRILATAGFNPMAMPRFLKKLEAEFSDTTGSPSDYSRTHPLTLKRVSNAQAMASKYGIFKPKKQDQTYQYMREKIRVLSHARGKNAHLPPHLHHNIRRYAKASTLLEQGNILATLKIIGKHSTQKSEALLIAKALLLQKKYSAVIQLLKPLVRLYPGENALIIPLANAYLGLKDIPSAWSLINHVIISEQSSLIYFEVRQQIARQAGLIGAAYHSVAERNIRIGQYQHAISQILQAMKANDMSQNELEVLQRLLRQTKHTQKILNH